MKPRTSSGKPPSRRVAAWACGICHNVFRATKHAKTKNGRAFADACCTCTVEGCTNVTGQYIGGRGKCSRHLAEEDLARAEHAFVGAKDWLEKARRRAEDRT